MTIKQIFNGLNKVLFKRLLDFPSRDEANAVFDFINTVRPDLFADENQPSGKESEVNF